MAIITGSLQIKGGKYYAVINLKDADGKRKPKWISTGYDIKGNKKKAEKFLNEKISEYNKSDTPCSDMYVADYFENWLDQIKPEVAPNTYRSYFGNMKNHIIPYFKDKKIKLQELKPYQLEDYYRFKTQPNSKLGSNDALSPTTIKHHHQNISKALADAVKRGLIQVNPASSAKTPKSEKFKANFLNPSQLNELLLLFKGTNIEIPVTLGVVYGFRRSEIAGLTWNAIDFENKTITIYQTVLQNTGGDYVGTTKNESSYRTLPLIDSVAELLKKHKQLQNERRKIMGDYYNDSDYVCTWPDGKLISPNYITKTYHQAIIKSNLPYVRFHDLRHSVASNLLAKGFSVVQVAEWLGHSSTSTTLNFYSHVDKTSKVSIGNELENMINLKND